MSTTRFTPDIIDRPLPTPIQPPPIDPSGLITETALIDHYNSSYHVAQPVVNDTSKNSNSTSNVNATSTGTEGGGVTLGLEAGGNEVAPDVAAVAAYTSALDDALAGVYPSGQNQPLGGGLNHGASVPLSLPLAAWTTTSPSLVIQSQEALMQGSKSRKKSNRSPRRGTTNGQKTAGETEAEDMDRNSDEEPAGVQDDETITDTEVPNKTDDTRGAEGGASREGLDQQHPESAQESQSKSCTHSQSLKPTQAPSPITPSPADSSPSSTSKQKQQSQTRQTPPKQKARPIQSSPYYPPFVNQPALVPQPIWLGVPNEEYIMPLPMTPQEPPPANTINVPEVQMASAYRIGRYTPAERKVRIQRYREKRRLRNYKRKIKYGCRKMIADKRVRVQGRFVKRETEMEIVNRQTDGGCREGIEDVEHSDDSGDAGNGGGEYAER